MRLRLRLLPNIPEIGWTPYLWLIYITFFVVYPLATRPPPRTWAAVVLALGLFLVLYFRGFWRKGNDLFPVVLGQTLLGVLFLPIFPGASVFFVYATATLGFVGPPRVAVRWLAAVVAVLALETWLLHAPLDATIPSLVMAVLIGAANIHFAEAHRNRKQLALAQEEIEHLAKLAERERIARDLHDLLGHTLSVVALKADLAARLLERDPDGARREIGDVQRISREALGEVRRAVQGYRDGGFTAELQSARAALAAAGVALEEQVAPPIVAPAVEAVAALALREAVTNVVRHAAAHRCRIVLRAEPPGASAAHCAAGERLLLEVSDDGRGGEAREGTGLAGMRERVAMLGGVVERNGEQGTRLRVLLPLQPLVEGAA